VVSLSSLAGFTTVIIEATRYYYSIVPRLSDTLRDKTEMGFNAIVPEVAGGEE
jgi:hypothetical protein